MRTAAVLLGLLVAAPAVARAGELDRWDRVELRDGRVVLGSVTREEGGYRIELPLGSMRLKAGEVRAVFARVDPLDELKRMRAEGLPTGTVDERFRFATFCEQNGLREEAQRAYLAVLRLDPDHEGARLALGYVRYEGRWLTFAERQRALGLVRYGGAWMTPAQRDQQVARGAREEAARIEREARARAADLEAEAQERAAWLEREAQARAEARARRAEARLAQAEADARRVEALAAGRACATPVIACAPRRRRREARPACHSPQARRPAGRPARRPARLPSPRVAPLTKRPRLELGITSFRKSVGRVVTVDRVWRGRRHR